jgi:hypothetical protein
MAPVIRPDVNTKFHIDLDWWQKSGRDIRVEVYNALCLESRASVPPPEEIRAVDWIDPQTGEVTRVDILWDTLMGHCAHQHDYVTSTMPLTRAILRVLLANGNQPLSATELHQRIRKGTPQSILRVLLGSEMREDAIVPLD